MSVSEDAELKAQVEAQYERGGTDALDGESELDEHQATVVTLLSSCHDDPVSR